LEALDKGTGHIVNASRIANEIIKLELIHLPPEFPDFELGSRIKVTQRGITDQAARYQGDVRRDLFQVVRSICDFAKKNKSFSKKILGVDLFSSTGRKQALTILNLLGKEIGRIVSRLENLQTTLVDVRSKLSDQLKELGLCIAAYYKGYQDLEKERQEQLRLRQQLEEIERQKRDITWRVVKTIGIIALVATGVGAGVGLCMYGGVAGVTWSGGLVLKTMASATVGKSIAAGVGVASLTGGVGMACYAPEGLEHWKKCDELSTQIQYIKSQQRTTPDVAMDNIHDKLENLDALGNSLHTQLGMIKSDWQQLQTNMKTTMEKLEDCEPLVDLDVDILKEQIRDAQKSWGVVLQWAGALNDKPSQDVSCLEAALNAITMSS
jgi:uncharacterized phage infection (PIP) family protein YhgE